MKKTLLLIIAVLAVAIALWQVRPRDTSHPRADEFVSVYVDLALLQQYGDTLITRFTEQRDSVLARHGFTDSSLSALKEELNKNPLLIARIWDDIERRLRDLKDEYSPLDLQQSPDTTITERRHSAGQLRDKSESGKTRE